MDITFKNVGQGDSLLLEWQIENITNIGIIDCNKLGKTNPVLEYLKEKDFKKIEFIILSHPHEDHYSGLLELLSWIAENKISVGWFGHTIYSIGTDYWRYFELGRSAKSELDKIFHLAKQLIKDNIIKRWEFLGSNSQIPVSDDIVIKGLSPSPDEIEVYQNIVKLEPAKNKKEASQAANLLSTVLKLSHSSHHILLTSDAAPQTLDRLIVDSFSKEECFSIIQVPHHGSKKNFSKKFWEEIICISENKKAVISAGYNLKYKHPDLDVLQELNELNFVIHSTSIEHGMKEFVKLRKRNLDLDAISILDETEIGGDKKFTLTE